jgi:subfamily B ATP-binding cassette protein MsbA
MKYQKVKINRILDFIKPESLILFISLLNSLLYVFLNSLSIWLTASLINNVLTDFDKLIQDHKALVNQDLLSFNDRLKILANDLVLRESNIETLKTLCISIIIIFFLKNIFLYLKNLSMSYVQLRLVTNIRNSLYAHLQTLSLSFFDKRKFGDLSSVIIHDVGVLNKSIGTTFHKIIVEPINILVFTILLFIISPKLMLVAFLIIPFSQIIIQFIGKSIRRKARRNTKQIGGIMAIITETISSIRIVKAFAMEEHEVKRFNNESWKYFNLLFRSGKLNHISSPIIESIGVSMAVLLLWLGGSDVMTEKSLSSEDFLRFMFLLFAMLGPVRSLSNVHIVLQNGYASAERIFELLDEKPDIKDSGQIKINSIKENIQFEKIRFNYGGELFSLKNISFTIKTGTTVALVGVSGSGKSTIADLIPRFYDVTDGLISIDGMNIQDIQIKSLRSIMGIVTQETILLNDTLRANITYGSQSVNELALLDAMKSANALEFIEDLNNGLDTIIGEKGVKLSGGQRQRIAIARAIYKNPPLLILDEATSALDSKSERLVQNALENLMKNRTVIVIAHRLSTVRNADQIIVLDKGQIIEKGSHQALYNSKGFYYKLHNIQFENLELQ